MSSKPSSLQPEDAPGTAHSAYDLNPPTVAAFSPATLSGSSAASKQRSTIIVHKKSPLLVATPPQITRALAYSHPFILPLNKLVGLLSWSTDDPWESFLLVAGFWAIVLYGSGIIKYAGPVIVVTVLILGMYSRRYSPLSSTSQTGEKHEKGHNRQPSEPSSRHHKSLDEIVEALREFTTRCNLLLDPFLRLTDFLSTQRTATSATTRPALTTLFIRILLITPIWVGLTLPPLYIITPRRIILVVGTISLTWHSRPARVSRVILWRSILIRRTCSFMTGLSFPITEAESSTDSSSSQLKPSLHPRRPSQANLAAQTAASATKKRRPNSTGVRFTFILYENQRRWLGLGWTTSLFAYERGPWTDEHNNPAPTKDEFELPDVEGGHARWRWVEGSTWKIEHGENETHSQPGHARSTSAASTASRDRDASDGGGWIYYDNKWQDGRREDGWGRYTRRRKWYRDAELVEVTPSTEVTPAMTPNPGPSDAEDEEGGDERSLGPRPKDLVRANSLSTATANSKETGAGESEGAGSVKKRRGWFGRSNPSTPHAEEKDSDKHQPGLRSRRDSKGSSSWNTGTYSGLSERTRDGPEEDHLDQWRDRERNIASATSGGWGTSEDVAMGLS